MRPGIEVPEEMIESRMRPVREALGRARRIAILRLGSLGDIVATLPFAPLLRDLLPHPTTIHWVAHPGGARLLEGLEALDGVVSVPRSFTPTTPFAWRRILEPHAFDCVVDLHGNLKSGLLSFLSGAPTRIGFDRADLREPLGGVFSNLRFPPLASGQKTRRVLQIAALLGHERPEARWPLRFLPEEADRAESVLARLGNPGSPTFVLQLGRLEDVRAWAPENWALLARRLADRGRRVIILGGVEGRETGGLVRTLLEPLAPCVGFEVGTLSLREVGALAAVLAADVDGGHAFAGGDTGCLHLAAASGLRTLGLYGPQDPARTAPLGSRVRVLFHPEIADCVPCGSRECFHPIRKVCMESIHVAEVAEALTGDVSAPAVPLGEAPVGPSPARLRSGFLDGLGVLASILLVSTGLLFLLAARAGIWDTQELLDAAVARELWPSGDALAPTLNGSPARVVPGLHHALASISLSILGRGDVASRLPSILAGGLLVAAVFVVGRRAGSPVTGMLAAAILLTSQGFFASSTRLGCDILWVALLALGIAFEAASMDARGRSRGRSAFLAATCFFLVFLSAGWVGWGIGALVLVLRRAADSGRRRLLASWWVAGAAAVLLSAAWAVLVSRGLGVPFWDAVGGPCWLSSFGAASNGSGSGALGRVVEHLLPGVLLSPWAIFAHLKIRRYREDLGIADRRWRDTKLVLCASALVTPFAGLRSEGLALALLAPLALLTSAWLEGKRGRGLGSRAGSDAVASRRGARWTILVPLGLLALVAVAFTLDARRDLTPEAEATRSGFARVEDESDRGRLLVGFRWSEPLRALVSYRFRDVYPDFLDAGQCLDCLRRSAETGEPRVALIEEERLAELEAVLLAEGGGAALSSLDASAELHLTGRSVRLVRWLNP